MSTCPPRPNRAAAILIAACCGVLGVACGSGSTPSDDKDGCFELTWYRDVDGDGAGDSAGPYQACDAPIGHVANADDCDDQDAEVHPDAAEACDGIDNDCNGEIDDGADGGAAVWYADVDSDGYGDPDAVLEACVEPAGHVANDEDCNDDDPSINPEGDDLPRDGIDGDCDGLDADSLSERAHVGDATLLDDAAVAAFCDDYDAVVGDLQIAGAALSGELAVDCLVEVTGDLLISTDSVDTLSLPSLWWVGGELRMAGNPSLADLDVSSLRFVDGPLVLIDNDVLDAPVFAALEETGGLPRVDSAELPVLTDVHGDVALTSGLVANALARVSGSLSISDGTLEVVALPSLESVGVVDLRSVRVTTVALDALTEAAGVSVELPDLGGALSLPVLDSVEGDFIVEQGSHTVSLPSLQTVGGSVSLAHEGVETIDVDALTDVGGDLLLGGPELATAELSGLETAGGAVSVTCPACTELLLPTLVSTGGDLTVIGGSDTTALDLSGLSSTGGGLAVVDTEKVRDIDLSSLATVGGPVSLRDLDWLETVDLSVLTNPPEEVELRSLPALLSVDLTSLRLGGVGGELVILDNPLLTTLSLDALQNEAGSITIQDNGALTSVDLSGLTHVGHLQLSGSFDELDLSQLVLTTGVVDLSLDAAHTLDLGALDQVGGDLSITGPVATLDLGLLNLVGGTLSLNAADPTSLDLGSLQQVLADVTLQLNLAEAIDLDALESVGGTATFQHGSALSNLSMPALESVGTLTIQALPALTTLSATALEATNSDVNIVENTVITELSGLAGLQTVGGSLAIVGNPALDDVTGLSGITSIADDLRIQDNTALSTADAESLAYDDIGSANVGGGITITGNAP